MCGILVSTDQLIDFQEFKAGLKSITGRGPDSTRTEIVDGGVMAFKRLAIMGLNEAGMQPFHLRESAVVCNGEIYCFRPIKERLEKKYEFISESDCEIILPLYDEMGVDMFKELDAEFAMVIYDNKVDKWIAARDPIGIRPLFYGYTRNNKIAFASEAKALQPFCHGISPFPPGHYYLDGEFICYNDIWNEKACINDNLDKICQNINQLLTAGVVKRMDADAPVGYLLSGGLDSSLVCAIAQKKSNKPIKTFSVGMDVDAIDLKYAKTVADYIGSDHTEIVITKDDVLACLDEVISKLETFDITTIRASIGMYLICKKIKETTDIKVLFTGEISDELFGYKYTDFAPDSQEFQAESRKRIKELYMYDVLRADRCISSNSIEGRVPFGDLEFVEYVMSIDPKLKMNTYKMGKYLLRRAFENDLLPASILYRDKAAFSDAVGHSLVEDIKDFAEKYYSDYMFEKNCSAYNYHCPPYTKESLLYREIFEKHYPQMATMVDDYWLPNQNWDGCKVDDPSARVLSNYGKSGE